VGKRTGSGRARGDIQGSALRTWHLSEDFITERRVSASTQLGSWLQAEGIARVRTRGQTFAWIFCAVFPQLRTGLELFSPQPCHFLTEVLAFSWLSDQLKLPGVEGHLNLTLLWPLGTESLATTSIFAPRCT